MYKGDTLDTGATEILIRAEKIDGAEAFSYDDWLYAYLYGTDGLKQLRFTYALPEYAVHTEIMGNAPQRITEDVRVWMPGDPILLAGEGSIGWRDIYALGPLYTYCFFRLDGDVFIAEESE